MRDYQLGVYEKFMPNELTLAERLAYGKAAGFDYLELSIDETDARLARLDWSAEERAALRKNIAETGMPILTMCLSGHRRFPLGSTDPAVEARSLEIMQKAIDLAADIGIRIIQLAGYDVYYEPSIPETVARFARNLEKCVKMAARRGVVLGFETMETPFMNTVTKAMVYVDMVQSPWLQVYPDIGNLTNGTDDVPADISRGIGHIAAAHLKETKEGVFRDIFPGEGRVDFAKLIPLLRGQKVRMFTAECWYRAGDDWQQRMRDVGTFYRQLLEA